MSRRVAAAVDRWDRGACTDRDALLLDACLRYGLLPNELDAFEDLEELVDQVRARGEEVATPTRVPGLVEADAADHPLFERGDPSRPAAIVPRRFLEVLGGDRYEGPQSGRRALADDLADADNPLTARVMVNRVWHHLFGRGIVATPDNFGRLGAAPTHPELLDHLAARFVEDGWSIKRLIRYLVTSKSWQLASAPPPGADAADPDGAWRTHVPVRRLTAEGLRDSLFAVAGALSDDAYGPAFGANSTTPRRSVYVRTKRNDLDAFLATFDAPTPFAPGGARLVTNVPAQSLAMLNDPLVWELAGRWAGATASVGDDARRTAGMFEATTGRPPTQPERERLLQYVRDADAATARQRAERADTDAALAAVRAELEGLLEPQRRALLGEETTQAGPAPTASWDFREGLQDQVGALHGELRGSAVRDERGLVLDGRGWLSTPALGRELTAKTLEAWVQLDGLDQQGGGVVTVQDLRGDMFDALVYGERERRRWIAGSDHFRRTDDVDGDGDADVLSASADGVIAWYENTDALGTLGPQQVITATASNAIGVFASDLDDDGDADVLSASANDDKIAWYENLRTAHLGTGCAGLVLRADAPMRVGVPTTVTMDNVPAASPFGLFMLGSQALPSPFALNSACTAYILPNLTYHLVLPVLGQAQLTIPVPPDAALVGVQLGVQGTARSLDPSAWRSRFAVSNGLLYTIEI